MNALAIGLGQGRQRVVRRGEEQLCSQRLSILPGQQERAPSTGTVLDRAALQVHDGAQPARSRLDSPRMCASAATGAVASTSGAAAVAAGCRRGERKLSKAPAGVMVGSARPEMATP
jgi:hypothetical protein